MLNASIVDTSAYCKERKRKKQKWTKYLQTPPISAEPSDLWFTPVKEIYGHGIAVGAPIFDWDHGSARNWSRPLTTIRWS